MPILDPARAAQLQKFLQYMRSTDLLANYHDWEHVERGLHSVLRRLGRTSLYNAVCIATAAQRDSGERAFRLYFSDLQPVTYLGNPCCRHLVTAPFNE